MSTSKYEAEQRKLAKMLEAKPVLARVAVSSFIAAFELLKPKIPERKKPT